MSQTRHTPQEMIPCTLYWNDFKLGLRTLAIQEILPNVNQFKILFAYRELKFPTWKLALLFGTTPKRMDERLLEVEIIMNHSQYTRDFFLLLHERRKGLNTK